MDPQTAERNAQELKAQAQTFFKAEKYNRAANVYTEIIEQYGNTALADTIRIVRCNRAQCYVKLKKFDLAAEDCNAVLENPSQSTRDITLKAYLRLACSRRGLGQLSEALEALNTFRTLSGSTPEERDLRKDINSKMHPQPPSNPANLSVRPLRYNVQIGSHPAIIIIDEIPAVLCTSNPPEVRSKMFLANLVRRHDGDLMRRQAWTCWNCPRMATCMTHTPCAYFHLPEPMVVDYVQPVCINQGRCDMEARQFMAQEMARVTAAFPK
ncbi:hypothetical protein Hypma_004352 [Hypsizygus marmoreus]|uniref:Uncharacterized protein n=1 Tax=Hypsizygus marmoreus TaxID=39966 RepID=A0A369K5Y1_HYPMA|nr:hypothetical protein Hypma_004352 [Hypsizygus marmoreus]